MTAEKKKGKYVYYRCIGSRGTCGNSYMREELLAERLGDVITPIQITPIIAEQIAQALRSTDHDAEYHRVEALHQVEQRRRAVVSKLDRGYEDYLEGRISLQIAATSRTAAIAGCSALELHLRPRKSQAHLQ